MPSPVGHALGGLAAAFVVDSLARRPTLTLPLLAASAVMAVAPDLDILAGSHRTYSHSVGAVAIVGVVSWLALRARGSSGAAAAGTDRRIRIAPATRLVEQGHVLSVRTDGAVAVHDDVLQVRVGCVRRDFETLLAARRVHSRKRARGELGVRGADAVARCCLGALEQENA